MVEKTDIIIVDLRVSGVEEDVLEAVELLTHRNGISYEDYVMEIVMSGNKIAIQVKLNDLHHNLWRAKQAIETLDVETRERKALLDENMEIAVRHDWAEKYIQKELLQKP